MLDPGEVWQFSCSAAVPVTTTSAATATGVGNGQTVSDTASVTVEVAGGTGGGTPTLIPSLPITGAAPAATPQKPFVPFPKTGKPPTNFAAWFVAVAGVLSAAYVVGRRRQTKR